MATWITHTIIADRVLEALPSLCRHEFYIGNIAPDCNIENEDWTAFTPSREITHWMTGKRKVAADCDRFFYEYMKKKTISSIEEESFLWGYYAHLIADAEFQRYIRDEDRVRASWKRIQHHPELREKAQGMAENWDSIKALISTKERMKDIYAMEKAYLDKHPSSGYLTEIIGLTEFPDYIDYLPHGAIPRKIKVMGYMPQDTAGLYPYICMSIEEYHSFLDTATDLVIQAILTHKNEITKSYEKIL